jgi:hypothetical protein
VQGLAVTNKITHQRSQLDAWADTVTRLQAMTLNSMMFSDLCLNLRKAEILSGLAQIPNKAIQLIHTCNLNFALLNATMTT